MFYNDTVEIIKSQTLCTVNAQNILCVKSNIFILQNYVERLKFRIFNCVTDVLNTFFHYTLLRYYFNSKGYWLF